jgi:hypothetical protein
MIVRDGTLIKIRTVGLKVLGLTFQCPCGRTSRVRVCHIVGQNEDTVQFKCKGCASIVNLPKKKEVIEKVLQKEIPS